MADLATLFNRLNDAASAQDMTARATALHAAILTHCVSSQAVGADGPIFASATDGKQFAFTEIPPGIADETTLAWIYSRERPHICTDL